MRLYVAAALLCWGCRSIAGPADDAACQRLAETAFPALMIAPLTTDRTTAIAHGDYDGDGQQDIALLLVSRDNGPDAAIAVCLSSKRGSVPDLIKFADADETIISTSPRGSKYYDFQSGQEGVYERDGINVHYHDCCGATYIFREGVFESTVDDD